MESLQDRAKRLSGQFSCKSRNPLVIEFAGVPKAGKTTILTNVQKFLKRCGFHTDVVVERASVCPIRDKKHPNFNIWTACTTLSQILEKTQSPPQESDPQILFLDRGIFDSICWLTMMEKLSRLRSNERELIQKFLLIDDWRKRISAVFVMLVSPKDAMQREEGVLPLEDTSGSIMNVDVLKQIQAVNRQCVEQFQGKFRIYEIDTSSSGPNNNLQATAQSVVDVILGLIEEHIAENVLSCPKGLINDLFGSRQFISQSKARSVVKNFEDRDISDFRPREDVEADSERVQALPIVIVRNADGDVLLLRRREKRTDNPLHRKMVIWAGGHVRVEDAGNGTPLVDCVVRELGEELRLQIEPSSAKLVGALYFDYGERTSKHAAVVYEWRATDNDVSIVLSRTEFFEKRGTSLSGRFASIEELSNMVEQGKMKEPWSVELIREYLAKDRFDINPRLL